MKDAETNNAEARASKWAPDPRQQPGEVKLKATPENNTGRLFLSLHHDVFAIRSVGAGSVTTFDVPVETLTLARKKRAHLWLVLRLVFGIVCWLGASVFFGYFLTAPEMLGLPGLTGFAAATALLVPLVFLARTRRPVVVMQFALRSLGNIQNVKFTCWLPSAKEKLAQAEKLFSDIESARQKTTGKLEAAVASCADVSNSTFLKAGGAVFIFAAIIAVSLERPWMLLFLFLYANPLYKFLKELKYRKKFAELCKHAKNHRWEEALAWMQAYEAEDSARRGETLYEQIDALVKMKRHGDALKCLESYKAVIPAETFAVIRYDLRLRMHIRMRKETGVSASAWF